jgi:hypothetical protein
MDVVVGDLLSDWIGRAEASGSLAVRSEGLRFAFYGRVSTASFQDRDSSRRWQRDVAEDLVAGHGSTSRHRSPRIGETAPSSSRHAAVLRRERV